MGREDAKLLKMVFSHFTKKSRMRMMDDKLLKMLNCFYMPHGRYDKTI
jgi:hypothetical protein